jgi:uncharacterized protein with HEPN domain
VNHQVNWEIQALDQAAGFLREDPIGVVPWRAITDMRNRVSHGYFDVDLDVVWNTVTRDLPKLQESVTRILAELDSEAEDSR